MITRTTNPRVQFTCGATMPPMPQDECVGIINMQKFNNNDSANTVTDDNVENAVKNRHRTSHTDDPNVAEADSVSQGTRSQ